jgi:hypothetical protein
MSQKIHRHPIEQRWRDESAFKLILLDALVFSSIQYYSIASLY